MNLTEILRPTFGIFRAPQDFWGRRNMAHPQDSGRARS
jgi:hypothetical protein